jgi:multiple sugar transport system substrate-binding protein
MASQRNSTISRRSFLRSGAMLVGLGAFSAACTAVPASPAAQSDAPAKEAKELRLTTWEDWEQDQGFLTAWDTFHERTGVTIDPEHIPWSGYPDKMVTLAAANSMPDILRVNGHMTPVFGSRQILLALDSFIERDSFDMEIYYPLLRRIYQYPAGTQLCLPQDNANYSSTYYNVTLFQEAGLEPPGDNWTYDDLRTYAQELTKVENGRTSQYGMVFADGGYPSPGVIAFGGQMSDDNYEPTKANIDSQEHHDLFQYVLQAIDEGIHPTIDALGELQGAATAFATGRVAMIVAQGLWSSNSLVQATGLEWDVLVSPRPGDKPHRFATAGAGWGAPAASRDPDVAWDFLQFFMGTEGTEIVLKGRDPEFIWPSAIKAFSEQEAEEKGANHPKLLECVNAAEDVIPWWALHPNVEEIWITILSPISDEIWRKTKSIDEGLAEMQEKMQALLDKKPA